MDNFETMEIGIVTLSLFLEDIPSIFNNIRYGQHVPNIQIYKNMVKNANELNKEFIINPQIQRQTIKQKNEERKETIELKNEIKKLREELKK